MEFFADFGLFALLIVFLTAFMGIISTKIAESLGGKKGRSTYEHDISKRTGWKKVERKR